MITAELNALHESIEEAERFLKRAKALRQDISDSKDTPPCQQRAATTRASLDLSRSLAEFRKARSNG